MRGDEIIEKITAIFKRAFPDYTGNVTSLTKMGDIDDWNSLNHLKLILMLEDEFHVKIKARESVTMTTVSKIAEVLVSKSETSG